MPLTWPNICANTESHSEAGRYYAATVNAYESVELARELYHSNPEGKHAVLALCLESYINVLNKSGDPVKADEIRAEMNALTREYNYDFSSQKCLCHIKGCSG